MRYGIESFGTKSITSSIAEVRLGQIGLATRQDRRGVTGLITADAGNKNVALALFNKRLGFAGLIVTSYDQEVVPSLEEMATVIRSLGVKTVWIAAANLDSPELSPIVRKRRANLPDRIAASLMESDITIVGRVKTVDPMPALLVHRKTGIATTSICGNVSVRERERELFLTAINTLAHRKTRIPPTRELWAYRPDIQE